MLNQYPGKMFIGYFPYGSVDNTKIVVNSFKALLVTQPSFKVYWFMFRQLIYQKSTSTLVLRICSKKNVVAHFLLYSVT